MDGYDLSKYIKTSHEYSHIPVILITSQPSKENELQGLSAGADAYIEKLHFRRTELENYQSAKS